MSYLAAIDEALLSHLRKFDTPTICNALGSSHRRSSGNGLYSQDNGYTVSAASPHRGICKDGNVAERCAVIA